MESLSIRESEVIFEVIKGKGIKEVANDLHISFYTADTHIKNAKKKTGARNMAELVFFYLKKNKHLLALSLVLVQSLTILNDPFTDLKKSKSKTKIVRVKTRRKND